MKNNRNLLYVFAIILAGGIYFVVQAQQRKASEDISFSGEWKSKTSISLGGNIVCSYDLDDRMRSKTMKIVEQANLITIKVPNPLPEANKPTSQEQLFLNGKEAMINHGGGRGKKTTAKLSADGRTMTVSSVVWFMVPKGSGILKYEREDCKVTEIWKLSNDGKSISIQANAKSNQIGKDRSWKTVFERVG